MQPSLQQFAEHNYLNLETFRRTGQGVPTPVWFVEDAGVLYVRTGASSGKVKRIRNNPRVKVVPSQVRGEPLGTWTQARAALVEDPAQIKRVNQLLSRKYGVQKRMFDLMGRLQKFESVTLAIQLEGDASSQAG